jgi:hypothetical protein
MEQAHISVEFYAQNVKQRKPEWSMEKCLEWLGENEDAILTEAEQAGFNCMEDLLTREEPNEKP